MRDIYLNTALSKKIVFHFIGICFLLAYVMKIGFIKLPLIYIAAIYIFISTLNLLKKIYLKDVSIQNVIKIALIFLVINSYILLHKNEFINQLIIFTVGVNTIIFCYINDKYRNEYFNTFDFYRVIIIYLSAIILYGFLIYCFGYEDSKRGGIYVNPLLRISSYSIFSITYDEGVRNSEQLIYILNGFLSIYMYKFFKNKYYKYAFYISLLALILAQSRAALIGILVVLIFNIKSFLSLFNIKGLKTIHILTISLIAILNYKLLSQIIMGGVSILAPDFSRAITDKLGMGWTYSNDVRLNIYKSALGDINFFGNGFSSEITSLFRNNIKYINYESTPLEILIVMGIPFLFIYLFFYIYLIYSTYLSNSDCKKIIYNAIFILFLVNIFDSQISSILFWTTLLILSIVIINEKYRIHNNI